MTRIYITYLLPDNSLLGVSILIRLDLDTHAGFCYLIRRLGFLSDPKCPLATAFRGSVCSLILVKANLRICNHCAWEEHTWSLSSQTTLTQFVTLKSTFTQSSRRVSLSSVPITERHQSRNSRQEPGGRNWSRDHGGMLFTGSFSDVFSPKYGRACLWNNHIVVLMCLTNGLAFWLHNETT